MDKYTQQAYQTLTKGYSRENQITVGSIVKKKEKKEGEKKAIWIGPFTVESINSSLQINGKKTAVIIKDNDQREECDINDLKLNNASFVDISKKAQRLLAYGAAKGSYLLLVNFCRERD